MQNIASGNIKSLRLSWVFLFSYFSPPPISAKRNAFRGGAGVRISEGFSCAREDDGTNPSAPFGFFLSFLNTFSKVSVAVIVKSFEIILRLFEHFKQLFSFLYIYFFVGGGEKVPSPFRFFLELFSTILVLQSPDFRFLGAS